MGFYYLCGSYEIDILSQMLDFKVFMSRMGGVNR